MKKQIQSYTNSPIDPIAHQFSNGGFCAHKTVR